ncbi:MAG: lysophospholipase [Alphaproteobacteria bacterium]|nr:lysophospholipase [Alphaproteobacteria bacterium]
MQALYKFVFILCTCEIFLQSCSPVVVPYKESFMKETIEKNKIIFSDGMTSTLREWPSPNPQAIILALHGFNDYSYAFELPGQYWQKHNITVYSFDQRGFGETPNRGLWANQKRMIQDVVEITNLIKQKHSDLPVYLLGESMGGALASLVASSDYNQQFTGFILISPAFWSNKDFNIFENAAFWIATHTVPWYAATGEGFEVHPSDNIEMLIEFSQDDLVIKETRLDAVHGLVTLMDQAFNTIPKMKGKILVLYGEEEDILPSKTVKKNIKRLAKYQSKSSPSIMTMGLYPKGYHMLLRDMGGNSVANDVQAWIFNQHLAHLPSKADQEIIAKYPLIERYSVPPNSAEIK